MREEALSLEPLSSRTRSPPVACHSRAGTHPGPRRDTRPSRRAWHVPAHRDPRGHMRRTPGSTSRGPAYRTCDEGQGSRVPCCHLGPRLSSSTLSHIYTTKGLHPGLIQILSQKQLEQDLGEAKRTEHCTDHTTPRTAVSPPEMWPCGLHTHLRTGSGRPGRPGERVAAPPARTWAGHLQAMTAVSRQGR